MVELVLPYPPSVNRYYRHVGPRTLISREGRAYRKHVESLLGGQGIQPTAGALAVVVDLFPPDRRRRDCDNAMKALLDAIEHGGGYEDDSQIVHLEVHKQNPLAGGRAAVCICPIDEFEANRKRPHGTHVLTCCSGCGRDVFRRANEIGDVFCRRCIEHGTTHAFPEDIDRKPLAEPEWLSGHLCDEFDHEGDNNDDWDGE